MNGRKIEINGTFDGLGDADGELFAALDRRLKSPGLWYGVQIHAMTPLGQTFSIVYKPENLRPKPAPMTVTGRLLAIGEFIPA